MLGIWASVELKIENESLPATDHSSFVSHPKFQITSLSYGLAFSAITTIYWL